MLEIIIIRLDLIGKVDYNHWKRAKDYVTFLKYLKAKNQKERESFETKGSIYKKMNEETLKIIRSALNPEDFNHDAWNERIAMKKAERKGITQGENGLIKKMIAKGKSDEDIADTTEIDIARIRELRASMS